MRTRSSVAALLTLTSTACRYSPLKLADAAGLDALAIGCVLYVGLSPNRFRGLDQHRAAAGRALAEHRQLAQASAAR